MTAVLGFSLSVAAVGLVLSFATALLVLVLDVTVTRWARLPAARHADVRFAFGILPAVACMLGAALTALPPLLACTGVIVDHCLGHAHHAHLCPVHFAGVHTRILTFGAVAIAVAVAGSGMRVRQMLANDRLLAGMRRLGESITIDGVQIVVLNGAPRFLHAGGVLDGFVLASRSLIERLSPASRAAALAHEVAHVHRRDALALRLLHLSAPVSPPGFGGRMRRLFLEAAEEAADAQAAAVVGHEAVATAIIDVARLRIRSPLDGMLPSCAGGLVERRVLRLLNDGDNGHRASALVPVTAAAVLVSALCLPAADAVHHVVETFVFSMH